MTTKILAILLFCVILSGRGNNKEEKTADDEINPIIVEKQILYNLVTGGKKNSDTTGNKTTSVTAADMVASPLANLAKAIEKGDAATVAEQVSYPLKRPTPIPSIKNKKEFIAYFPILFDDEFRQEMRNSTFSEDWKEVGWRGVMYSNGEFWVDGTLKEGGLIYSVNYSSSAELALQMKLIEEEKRTLHKSLLDVDYVPVSCFETMDGKTVGRIDELERNQFRIALFTKPVHSGDEPSEVFLACAVYEGSGGNHDYLDSKWLHVVSINVIGSSSTPPVELQSRDSWYDELGEARGANFRNWKDIVDHTYKSVAYDYGEKQWEYDQQGKEIRETYIGKDGKLFVNKDVGYAEKKFEYDNQGNMTRMSYYDADGNLMIHENSGYAEERYEYDSRGRKIREAYHGMYGEPRICKAAGGYYTEKRWEYDEKGKIKKESYFGENGKPSIDGEAHIALFYLYNEKGELRGYKYVHGAKILGEEAYAEIRKEYDEKGNDLREAYYDQDGHLVLCEGGYAEIRWVYNHNGKKIAKIFFDKDGKVCVCRKGFAKVIWIYDEAGNVVRTDYRDVAGKPVMVKDFDE